MIHGIDISAYQPHHDLEAAYNDPDTPMRFCVMKETEGEGWKNEYSPAQWEDLERVVINHGPDSAVGGSYHFARWDTPRDVRLDAREEARWFWRREQIRRENGHGKGVRILPPTLDVEWIKNKKRDPKGLLKWVLYWCEETTTLWSDLGDFPPMIYLGTSFWRYCLLPAGVEARALTQYLQWCVDYNSPMGKPKPMVKTEGAADKGVWPVNIHQYTGRGRVNGIYTSKTRKTLADVDKNVFFGSMDDLIRLSRVVV